MRVESIVLGHRRSSDLAAKLVGVEQDRVRLWVVGDHAHTLDEDVGATGVRGVVDSVSLFRRELLGLCNLELLLTIANTFEVVLSVDAVRTDDRGLSKRRNK
jgi:hypothetical protein